MKIRRLPDTDLANIAVLPTDAKRSALERFRGGIPPYTYAPVRDNIPNLLTERMSLLADQIQPSWEMASKFISRQCKTIDECVANLAVGQGFHEFCKTEGVSAQRYTFPDLRAPFGHRAQFWLPRVFYLKEQVVLLFLDPRRKGGLSSEAKRLVVSVMHHRVRALLPDFADAELAVFQFRNCASGTRDVVPFFAGSTSLFEVDDIEQMIAETYEIWAEVSEGRAEEARRSSGTGTLL